MLPGKNKKATEKDDIETIPLEVSKKQVSGQNVKAALEQAEEDIQRDPDLSVGSPNDDLDEGESARLGEDKNDLT